MVVHRFKYFFSYDRELRRVVKKMIAGIGTQEHELLKILDVGCGTTSMLSELAGDEELRRKCYLVGLDVYGPTIEWNKASGIHDEYVLSDIRTHAPTNKYDIVVATDLIEHFEKEEACDLLKKLESIAAVSVILITPNGYQENIPLDGNGYMRHKCGFDTGDLISQGYSVYGAGGFRCLRGMYSLPRGNRKIMAIILYFLSRLLRCFPKVSYHLVASKITS